MEGLVALGVGPPPSEGHSRETQDDSQDQCRRQAGHDRLATTNPPGRADRSHGAGLNRLAA